jgi:hypothetical protein
MQRERRRTNKNTETKPSQNFIERKFDMDKLQPTPAQDVDLGPLAKAKVAKGRSIHIPTGTKKIVGTRAAEVNGAILYRDVTAQETRSAGPGEIVELPINEIERLTELGFVTSIDGQLAKGMMVKPVRPQTGIDGDPRLSTSRQRRLSAS